MCFLASVDAHGEVLHPLPLAHRQMASPACLPHIAQVEWECDLLHSYALRP